MDDEEFRQAQRSGTNVLPWSPDDLPTLRAAYSDRTATLMAFFAAFAYELPTAAGIVPEKLAALGFTSIDYFQSGLIDGLALVADSPTVVVVAFRGTRSFRNWQTNIDVWPQHLFLKDAGKDLRVHEGFYDAYVRLRDNGLKTRLEQIRAGTRSKKPIYVTGHSLGGALAEIASAEFGGDDLAACYTFGQPRVGNAEFDQWVKAPCYRVINYADIVPQIPPPGIYRHSGDPRYLPRISKMSPFRFEPGPLIRLWQLLQGTWQLITTFSLLGIQDHSMERYSEKLVAVVAARGQQRTPDGLAAGSLPSPPAGIQP